jgi:hypothetical protein
VREDPELQATVARAVAADTWHTEDTHYPSGDDEELAQVREDAQDPDAWEQQIEPEVETPVEPQQAAEDEAQDEPEQPYAGLKVDPFAALRAGMNRQ